MGSHLYRLARMPRSTISMQQNVNFTHKIIVITGIVLWMYKLHNDVHLLSEISFVKTYEKLCKFPMEFALKIISAYI